jgi:DNA-binding MarR family transcriptional regulator
VATKAGSPATTDAARAMDALRRIVHALHSANARAEGSLRVTAAQLFVLRQIAAAPGLSLSALAARTRGAQSSVSEVVSRLVAQGLVQRRASREDARRIELSLAAGGRAIAARAGETIQETLVAAFERLPPAQQESLAQGMEEWLRSAGLEGEAAAFFFEKAKGS